MPNLSMQIDLFQYLPAVSSAIAAFISAWAAYLLYRVTREMKQFNRTVATRSYMTAVIQSINQTNMAVLSDDRNISAMKSLGLPEPTDSLELGRKEWLIFMWLNELQLTYIGHIDGLLETDFATPTINQLVPILMKDDTAYRLVRTRGYDKRFVNLCEGVREHVVAKP